MEQRTVDYKGKKLSYRTRGEGPVVILLHGFGEHGAVWQGQYDIFPNHQLVIPDLPGSGASEMIDDMSMEGMAEAIREIINPRSPQSPKGEVANAQPTPVNDSTSSAVFSQPHTEKNTDSSQSGPAVRLIGHSMGGYIALAFAAKYPQLLQAFGLFHSTAYADSEEKKATRRKGIAFIKEQGSEAFLKTTIPGMFSSHTKEHHPALVETAMDSAAAFSDEALIAYYEAMMARPDRTDVLRNSKVPVLFVMGRHDTAIPIDDMLKQSHLPAIADVHILEQSGHMGMVEELARSNKILSEFATLETPD